jgi:hypothetical protein
VHPASFGSAAPEARRAAPAQPAPHETNAPRTRPAAPQGLRQAGRARKLAHYLRSQGAVSYDLTARMLAISCGYPDVNDFDWLRCDAAFNLACGRLPETAVTFAKLAALYQDFLIRDLQNFQGPRIFCLCRAATLNGPISRRRARSASRSPGIGARAIGCSFSLAIDSRANCLCTMGVVDFLAQLRGTSVCPPR